MQQNLLEKKNGCFSGELAQIPWLSNLSEYCSLEVTEMKGGKVNSGPCWKSLNVQIMQSIRWVEFHF